MKMFGKHVLEPHISDVKVVFFLLIVHHVSLCVFYTLAHNSNSVLDLARELCHANRVELMEEAAAIVITKSETTNRVVHRLFRKSFTQLV